MAYDESTLKSEISGANDSDIIEITGDIYLTGTINVNKNITVQSASGNSFTIYQQATGRHFTASPAGVGGTLTLERITLDGMRVGGGLSSGKAGHLILNDSCIIQNCYAHNGGALSMNASGTGITDTAIMKNGSIIQNCSGELHGGAVYIGFDSAFTMENGSIIRECATKEYGGGIYIMEGSFIMNGGEISNCRSAGGGGVFLEYVDPGPSSANVTMTGGKITGCSAPFGGGILFLNTGPVMAMNTVVTGNFSGTYGGGIGILVGNLSNIDSALVSNNTAQLSEGPDAQIYIYADHLYASKSYTVIDDKACGTMVTLLSGEACEPIYFKVRDDNTGEYLVAFCSELGTNLTGQDFFAHYSLPSTRLSREQTDKIAVTIRVALNGERFYDVVAGDTELSTRAYVAQYVIWNIELGYSSADELITTIDRVRTALGDNAAVCLDEIVSAIRLYENPILPSFAGSTSGSAKTVYLEYDSSEGKYKITLTDTSGVLRYFAIDPSSLPQGLTVVFDYDNHTMTIICADESVLGGGNVILRLVSLLEDGDASAFFHPLYQDLAIPDNRYEIMISAYVKPLIAKPTPTPKKPCTCYAKATKCRKSIIGHKIWVDNNNAGDTRPPTVEILLLRDGEVYKTIIMDSSDDDAFIFCCVPIGKRCGHTYDYQIDEAAVPGGYTKSIDGYNIINTLI